MNADGVVRGFVATMKQWQPMGELSRMVVRNKSAAYKVPVLLIPDDGTKVVVGREEWERMERDHRAMEKLRAVGGTLDYYPNEMAAPNKWTYRTFNHVGRGGDPSDAILGTPGGGE